MASDDRRVVSRTDATTVPAQDISADKAMVRSGANLPIREGEVRQAVAEPSNDLFNLPPSLRAASNIAYSAVGVLIVLLVAVAFVTFIVWFISDLGAINPKTLPAGVTDRNGYNRNLIINAIANFISNLVLMLILVEVVSAIVTFLRTRRPTARPILLIPLFIVTRAVILLVNQLLVNPPDIKDGKFLGLLATLGAFSFVGLSLSIALAALREREPRRTAQTE